MSEPLVFGGAGFLLAIVLVYGARWFARSRVGRLARKKLEATAPKLLADIEADMGELHAQIAVATRRLETSVEQMKARTTSQLTEIGKSNEVIARLQAEMGQKRIALQALEARERALADQLRGTEAQLAINTGALEEVERKLADEKAELKDLLAFVEARDKLGEAERRHEAAAAKLKAENARLEEELLKAHEDSLKQQQEMANLRKQVEATWASERMANALLRERINDVAGEVVRVAHALEGLGSPIETMLAGKVAELDSTAAPTAPNGGNGREAGLPGDESKGTLAHRIRSLQKRSARVSSSSGGST